MQRVITLFYNPYLHNAYLTYAFSKIFKFEIEDEKADSPEILINRELVTIQTKKINSLDINSSNKENDKATDKANDKENKENDSKIIIAVEKEEEDDNKSSNKYVKVMNDGCETNNRKCFNQDLVNLIDHIKKPRKVVNIEHCDIASAYPFCISKQGEMSKNEKWLKMELIRNAEMILTKRMNLVNLQKIIDRYEVVENLILDEKQSWMFNNRQNRLMVNKSCFAKTEVRNFEEDKNLKKMQMISQFIKSEDNKMSKIDEYSYLCLDESIKTEIEKM